MTGTSRNGWLRIASLCLLAACGSDVATGRRCQNGDRACAANVPSAGRGGRDAPAAGASGSAGGISSGDNALTLHVEDVEGMTIEIITLACAGDCAEIEAVVHGGNPPYRLAWEDGSSEAARRVCLDASATLRVSATDTSITTEEFMYEAKTVESTVTANVLECDADAGVEPDAGGTFGCQSVAVATTAAVACMSPEGGLNPIENQSLRAGEAITFRVTGEGAYFGGEGWHYEMWGSSDGCALDELLGAFQLANGPLDTSVCLRPERSHPHLVLFYEFAPTDGVSLTTWELETCGGCEEAP